MDISRIPTGATIRKLTVGNTKTEGITYQVGISYKDKVITQIIRDENSQFLFGAIAYFVYVDVSGINKLWKIIERQPVTVEYFVNDETPEKHSHNTSQSRETLL